MFFQFFVYVLCQCFAIALFAGSAKMFMDAVGGILDHFLVMFLI
jgi:hypothetical protein